jgi:hypothetical protein
VADGPGGMVLLPGLWLLLSALLIRHPKADCMRRPGRANWPSFTPAQRRLAIQASAYDKGFRSPDGIRSQSGRSAFDLAKTPGHRATATGRVIHGYWGAAISKGVTACAVRLQAGAPVPVAAGSKP